MYFMTSKTGIVLDILRGRLNYLLSWIGSMLSLNLLSALYFIQLTNIKEIKCQKKKSNVCL